MATSRPGNRIAFGIRTAWLPPVEKILPTAEGLRILYLYKYIHGCTSTSEFRCADSSPVRGRTGRTRAGKSARSRVRELDRDVLAARLARRAPAAVVRGAQRAIDRADVMVGALPGVAIT